MKLGSLFDGAGTCCFAAELCGITPVWSSEIEKFPITVTAKRFPSCKQLGDITKINGAEIEPVDVITFGSPCQDLSVAGKRAGLNGERSSLFMEAIRVIKEMRNATANEFPRYIVWENVPGAFSSNKGEDFRKVLEEIVRIKDDAADVPRPASRGGGYGSLWGVSWETDSLSLGAPSTHSFGEFPKDVEESILSQILEANVDPKYYLSATACRGVLRRAVKRGKELPTLLKIALCLQGKLTADEITEMGIFREGELVPYDGTQVYDARGNGDGKTAPTLTGDHADRVTDYTAVIVGCWDMSRRDGARWHGEVSPTLVGMAGTGGNNTPCVIYIDYAAFNQGVNAKYDFGVDDKTAFTLTGKGPGAVCFAIGNGQVDQLGLHDKAGALNCMHDEQAVVYCLQGNCIDRADTAGCNGAGYKAGTSYTLNTVDRHAVAVVGINGDKGRLDGIYYKGCGAREGTERDVIACATFKVRCGCEGGGKGALVSEDKAMTISTVNDKWLFDARKNGKVIYVYVRRLTPTECARLQGMPDWWCADIPHADAPEYKMWGNGMALPNILYVMEGIVEKGEEKTIK